jgi:hypothetical protein
VSSPIQSPIQSLAASSAARDCIGDCIGDDTPQGVSLLSPLSLLSWTFVDECSLKNYENSRNLGSKTCTLRTHCKYFIFFIMEKSNDNNNNAVEETKDSNIPQIRFAFQSEVDWKEIVDILSQKITNAKELEVHV